MRENCCLNASAATGSSRTCFPTDAPKSASTSSPTGTRATGFAGGQRRRRIVHPGVGESFGRAHRRYLPVDRSHEQRRAGDHGGLTDHGPARSGGRVLIDRVGVPSSISFPAERRQSRRGRSRSRLQAAVRHRPVGGRAGRAHRRRLPVPRRRAGALRGRDAAVAARAAHAQGVRPDRHAHARRQPRLLADRLHHRRGLPADPARHGLHAARHRRHGGDQPHLRRGRAARRA